MSEISPHYTSTVFNLAHPPFFTLPIRRFLPAHPPFFPLPIHRFLPCPSAVFHVFFKSNMLIQSKRKLRNIKEKNKEKNAYLESFRTFAGLFFGGVVRLAVTRMGVVTTYVPTRYVRRCL